MPSASPAVCQWPTRGAYLQSSPPPTCQSCRADRTASNSFTHNVLPPCLRTARRVLVRKRTCTLTHTCAHLRRCLFGATPWLRLSGARAPPRLRLRPPNIPPKSLNTPHASYPGGQIYPRYVGNIPPICRQYTPVNPVCMQY